jgi:chorismate synthase
MARGWLAVLIQALLHASARPTFPRHMPTTHPNTSRYEYQSPHGSHFVIRPLATHDEYAACVALQHDTWGATFGDTVPASILMVAQKVGGVSAGAFDDAGRLVGFVFGMSGVRHGRPAHWSDMLAVRPEVRNEGLGAAMKEYQRDVVRGIGIETMYWTFDPLVARNAHLNFNKLGARFDEYVVNMYGEDTGSDLHRGIGSDRFVVRWDLVDRKDAAEESPNETCARIEIPCDIAAIQEHSLEEAALWRSVTRQAFLDAIATGCTVTGFQRIDDDRCFYTLSS